MVKKFYQSIFSKTDNHVESICADGVEGSMYSYKNVSRKAIATFMADDARSLGHFVNKVLKQDRAIGEKKRLDNVNIWYLSEETCFLMSLWLEFQQRIKSISL